MATFQPATEGNAGVSCESLKDPKGPATKGPAHVRPKVITIPFETLPREDQECHRDWPSWIISLYMKCSRDVSHFDDEAEAHDQWIELYEQQINRVTLGLVKQAGANKGDIVHFPHRP